MCQLRFYDESPQPRPHPSGLGFKPLSPGLFVIPEGTHCDLMVEVEIKPGDEAVLLTWNQEECITDRFGCRESVPVKPGRYKIVGEFKNTKGSETTTEGRFTIEPPS